MKRMSSMPIKAIAAALVLLLPAIAEAHANCAAPPDLKDGWRVAAPAEAGLDSTLVCAIGARFEAWKEANVHAVLVVRKGTLVYERYFTGEDERLGQPLGAITFDAATRHDLRSISKSVTALVFGIAVDRGWIKEIDTPVFAYFPEYADLKTPEKERITLRHLLTMSAGFAWNEQIPYSNPANSERQMWVARDLYRYVLQQPLATAPGLVYNYSGGATSLLAAIVSKTAGKPFDVVANDVLSAPLGIVDVEWVRHANGDAAASAGLRLRPRDLAKIGQLVLAKGAWQGKQVVPAAWIEQSIAPQINGEGTYFYGYQWWLGRSLVQRRAVEWAAGVGWGGQRLFILPSEDTVIVVHAGLYGQASQSAPGGAVLNRFVLPALVKP
jgi:CubicO group peptidase (beta-lactamase class C family)